MSGTEYSERERRSTGRSPQLRLRREAQQQAEVPPCPDCGEPRFSCLANTRRCKCDISSGHSRIVGGSNPSKKSPKIDLVLRLGPDPEIAEEEEEEEAVVKSDEKTGAVKGRNSGSKSVNPVLTKMPTAMSVNPVPDSSTEAERARMKTIIEAAKQEKQDPQGDSGLRERVMEALTAENFRCPHCNTDDTVFLRDFNNNKLDRPRYRCKKCPRPKQRFTVGATLRGSRPSSLFSRGADQPEEKLQLVAVDEREKSKPSPSLGRRHRGSRRSGVVIKEAEEQNKSPTSSSSSTTSSGKSGSQPRKLQKGDEPAVMSPLKESARMNTIESAVSNAANASTGVKTIVESASGPGTVTKEAFEGADQAILCPACQQGEAKFDYFNDGQARYHCKRCQEEWTVLDGESAVRVEPVKLTEFGFFS